MSATFEAEPGRLNGWKEIALHLGKGARTVQRWEKLYGLPVHRLGREGGEIVFAFRDEIDRWVARTERERAANGDEPPGDPEAEAGGDRPGLPARPRKAWSPSPSRPGAGGPWPAGCCCVVAAALATLSVLRLPVGRRGRGRREPPAGGLAPGEREPRRLRRDRRARCSSTGSASRSSPAVSSESRRPAVAGASR